MHDLDRTQLEFESGNFEEEDFQYESEEGEYGFETEGTLSEEEEMEYASRLLEVSDEAELEQFLGNLIRSVSSSVKKAISSPVGRALGGILKTVAKKALPVVGGALGTMVGGPAGGMLGGKLASQAGKIFGLELEGMSQEDQEFEVARRFVRLAGSAAKKAASASPGVSPASAAKSAVVQAARVHAPGLLVPSPDYGVTVGGTRRSGRWFRRGNKIVLYGVC